MWPRKFFLFEQPDNLSWQCDGLWKGLSILAWKNKAVNKSMKTTISDGFHFRILNEIHAPSCTVMVPFHRRRSDGSCQLTAVPAFLYKGSNHLSHLERPRIHCRVPRDPMQWEHDLIIWDRTRAMSLHNDESTKWKQGNGKITNSAYSTVIEVNDHSLSLSLISPYGFRWCV